MVPKPDPMGDVWAAERDELVFAGIELAVEAVVLEGWDLSAGRGIKRGREPSSGLDLRPTWATRLEDR